MRRRNWKTVGTEPGPEPHVRKGHRRIGSHQALVEGQCKRREPESRHRVAQRAIERGTRPRVGHYLASVRFRAGTLPATALRTTVSNSAPTRLQAKRSALVMALRDRLA